MHRDDLPPRMLLLVVIMLVLLGLGSCEDLSWLPDAPYDFKS
jgi:hypothetical protein